MGGAEASCRLEEVRTSLYPEGDRMIHHNQRAVGRRRRILNPLVGAESEADLFPGSAVRDASDPRGGQGPCTITIVNPVVPDSRDVTYNVLHGSSVSYEAARTQAVRRLRPALQVLRWLGASVDGETGAEDLVKAVARLSIVRIYENILGMAGSFPPRVVLRRGRLSARAESTHFFSLSSPVGWQSETT